MRARRKKAAGPGEGRLKPVEVRYTFAIRDRHGEAHTFSVTADLLEGRLDLAVSLAGTEATEMLPEELFAQVMEAIESIRRVVRAEHLVERDD